MPIPEEQGPECFRFMMRTQKAADFLEKTSNRGVRLKSELREARESDPSEQEEKSVSNYDGQTVTNMRATEYSNPSRGAWRGRMGSIPSVDKGIRKPISTNQVTE